MQIKETDSDFVALEKMVNAYTLQSVLNALVDTCHGKAEHLHSNWQDHNAAKVWENTAVRLMKLADRVVV